MSDKEGSVSSIIIQEGFKKRSDLHIERKIWHIGGVLILFLFYTYAPLFICKIASILAFLILISIDYYRLRNHKVNKLVTHYLRPIMRQTEVNSLAGTTFLISGVLILVFSFDRIVVQLSLLYLALADPIASFFGIKYGKEKILGNKTLQGFLAGFAVCVCVSWLFLVVKDFDLWRALVASILGGFIGAMAELVPIRGIDDNLTIPVISGSGLTIIFYIFGFI